MFTHLHCRSWFSFLAGGSGPEALAAHAHLQGVKALALTDINGIYGIVRFQKACRMLDIKPIFGSEVSVEGAPLVLIAADEEGLANLNRLLTLAHQRERSDPQATMIELMDHAKGLFCLTGSYGSRLWELIDSHRAEAAFLWVQQLRCIFAERLSIEIATHLHRGDRHRMGALERLSRETYVPLVATGDVRYARAEEYRRYDLMTCIRLGINIFDEHPERPRNAEAYLRSQEALQKLIPYPKAFARATEIAEACTLDLIPGFITPPAAAVPPPHSPREYLHARCREAFERRYPGDEKGASGVLSAIPADLDGFREWQTSPENGDGGIAPRKDRGLQANPGAVATSPVAFKPGRRSRYSTLYPQNGRSAAAKGGGVRNPGGAHSPVAAADSAVVCEPAPESAPVDPLRRPSAPAALRRKAAAQLRKELDVIAKLDLDDFFLVVHEIVEKARELGIRCAGRGSAANSIVAYLLGITGVDPVAHNLLFERFLHAGRRGTPDIDVDFDSDRRDEIIAWMEERFGIEQTAMTATVITYRVRSAIRDTAKVLGWPMDIVNRFSKAVPPYSGHSLTEYRVRLERICGSSPLLDKLLEMTTELLGAPRHLGLHSGGMVLSRKALHHFSPVQVSANGVKVLQFDKDDVEALGLVKFDVLGLRMLATLSEADEMIHRHGMGPLDIDELSLDDTATFNMMRASQTLGVFQIESQGQLHLLAQHQPEDFSDLINEIALFRPGPLQSGMVHPFVRRRRGQEAVRYDHPLLEPLLRSTYGVIVYQEQVLEVAHKFAGMSLEEADEFRRLMSRFRDPGQMEGMRERFISGAMKNGVSHEIATKVFENVANFVGYGFCRSHAAAFAKTVYQSAYLKRHHSAAFLAAFMQHRPGMYNLMTLEEEARRFGAPILLPDVNRSGFRYDIEPVVGSGRVKEERGGYRAFGKGGPDVHGAPRFAIRKPISSIQGISTEQAKAIVWERRNGFYTSIRDLYERIAMPIDLYRNLARSGALDAFAGDSRRALWEVGLLHRSVGEAGRRPEAALFDLPPFTEEDIPDLPSLTLDERLSWDYQTHNAARIHPMTLVRRTLSEFEIRSISTCYGLGRAVQGVGDGSVGRGSWAQVTKGRGVRESRDGPTVTVAGIAMLRQRPRTANGVMFLTLEDETGFIQCVIYTTVLEALDHVFSRSAVIVRGKLQVMGNWRGLVVQYAWPLNGILGGYEGHPSMGGGRDHMVKTVETTRSS
jgi:DNA polymerase III alpha subunit